MANISTLTVSLVANTARFTNDLKRARKDAKAFDKALTRAFRGAAVAATALAGGLAVLTKQSLALVDRQTKVARTLGTTQATFAGLTLAAGIAGVEQEQFTKALQRQQKAINDANNGLATQKRAFDALGLSTEQLGRLPVEQQFAAITTALANLENQTLRSGVAQDIFGARNAQLLNILELGERGLDQFIKKADELGVALTQEQTAAIEKANDALLVLKTSFTGLGNQLAARFSPAIIATAEFITNLVTRVTNAIPRFQAWAASIFGVRRELDQLTLKDLTAEQDQLRKQIDLTAGALGFLTSKQKAFLESRGTTNPAFTTQIQELQTELDDLLQRFEDAARARDKLLQRDSTLTPVLDSSGVQGSTTGESPVTRNTFTNPFGQLETGFEIFAEWERRAKQAFDNTRTPAEALRLKIEEIQTQLIQNPFFDEELAQREAQNAVDAYLTEMQRMADGSEEAFAEISEFAKQAGRNMQDDLSDFLFNPFQDGLDGMLKGFITTLRKMVANLLAQKILTSFFGLFGGGIGNLFGFNPGTASVPGRRIGGPVAAGQTVLGGEGRPELFTPGATGSLRPLGAVTIQQEVNFGGGNMDPATLIPILEENNRKLKAEIIDAFDRGAFV